MKVQLSFLSLLSDGVFCLLCGSLFDRSIGGEAGLTTGRTKENTKGYSREMGKQSKEDKRNNNNNNNNQSINEITKLTKDVDVPLVLPQSDVVSDYYIIAISFFW